MSTPPPASRNAPCPCGSGRRYKECHGAIGGSAAPNLVDRLNAARQASDRGDDATMARVCEEVLREAPEHPYALELLARRETDAGRTLVALHMLLTASRALSRYPLPPAIAYGVWTALNAAFNLALAGHDPASASVRRDYDAWQAGRRAATPSARDVAVVLAFRPAMSTDAVAAALDSLVAQTHRPAELIVVTTGAAPAIAVVRSRLDLLPFEVRLVQESAASAADAWNRGIEAARATWVAVLEPPCTFDSAHLASLVDTLVERGARWGFSDGTLAANGDVPAATMAAHSTRCDAASTTLAKADSHGLALIGQWSPLPGVGACLFERALHKALGGFRAMEQHEAWDFCLRAVWEDEPVRVTAATYRHAIEPHDIELPAARRESVQLAMFREFHARASHDDARPANPFAPSLAVWGHRYLRRLFNAGHVLMVDVDALERFVARIESSLRPAADLTPGINLVGFAFGEFGLGESLRAMARACDAGDIPFVVNDVDQHLATRQTDRSMAAHLADDIRHRLSLMCVNPDLLKQVQPLLARTRAAGGVNVGYWYWELETTPRMWEPAYEIVDEAWCASEFVAAAIRRATDKPVYKISPPIEISPSRSYERREFGLPDDQFLFLFTFDYNSFVMRKNPEAVIAAFKDAFPVGRDDVGLVVKSVNGTNRQERMAAILDLIAGDERIVHLDRFLTRDEAYGLIGATDAYVSLHRSEGLGLGLAEAMALGRPTIATGYSGNLEFMNERNSLLVDYRLVRVAPGEYLVDDERFVWADPDVACAARHMRSLADDRALCARLALAGQSEIRTRFSHERTASAMRARLADLGVL